MSISSAPLAIPASPSSSKRSRSRDSTRSAPGTASSVNTPLGNTPFLSPSVSTNSLIIPSTSPDPLGNLAQDPTPYPAFLRLNRTELDNRWNDLEWVSIQRARDGTQTKDPEQPSEWARCNGEEYVPRNRYGNVDPYQSNRVKLNVPEGEFDYINASPIVLESTKSNTPLKYIATQGPKQESWSHIWRMIWHENQSPAVIVMLTQTHEGGREKCFPYYPRSLASPDLRVNEHDEFQDGLIHDLKLTNLTNDEEARTQVREIDMTSEDGSESKKIWHLLFAGWPDFLVPEGADRAALLKLIDISREKNADNATNPRIVHCSAGIGRSGTFIALDWLLQELEEGSLDNVPDDDDPVLHVVETLRLQRPMMVQSKPQYAFIYDVIRERWRSHWIKQHPEEASKLGIRENDEPKLKKQKSMHQVNDGSGHDEERAQLEAELMGAELQFEKGKT